MCVSIYIINDTLIEADEEFSVGLTVIDYPSESNVEIDEDEKDITIHSDDGKSMIIIHFCRSSYILCHISISRTVVKYL